MNETIRQSIDALEGKSVRIVIEHKHWARQRAYNFVRWMERRYPTLAVRTDEQSLTTIWLTTIATREILIEAWHDGYAIIPL